MTNTLLNPENPLNDLSFSYENFERLKELLEQKERELSVVNQLSIDLLGMMDFTQSPPLPVDRVKDLPNSDLFETNVIGDKLIITGRN